MSITDTDRPIRRTLLRLWPGVLIVVLQWLGRFVLPVVVPGAAIYGLLAGVFGGLAVVLWWLFFSRAPWAERLGAIVLMVAGLLATSRIAHESVATGMMGMMLPVVAIPILSLALVAWAVASARLSNGPRRVSMVVAILLACGVFALLRTGGIDGDAGSDFHWRWTPTPEQRLLAQAEDDPITLRSAPAAAETPEMRLPTAAGDPIASPSVPAGVMAPRKRSVADGDERPPAVAVPPAPNGDAEWPGFRGPARDGIVRGVRIETDWSMTPPVALWRRAVGPGWSSFAVHANLIYTQEQRGDDEVVSCYNLTTGEPVWRHRSAARFWESNGGAGPRGTPTVSGGRVYAIGATGILNALDARDGSVVWSRNAASDTGRQIPGWGFTSSPLVVADVVIVALSGTLAAYDRATGEPRWVGPAGGWGYSSPHLVTIDGVTQILLLNGGGATSVAPADGALLWEHHWPGGNIVQPATTAEGDVLIGAVDSGASGIGTRRIAVAHGPGGWTTAERWTSTALKASFNDLVIHNDHVFGFDGSILACIDLKDGSRVWKGGRYGHGQILLVADQDLLLVLSEEGELALVAAAADKFTELARFPALDGKTWNHPVLVGDLLLIRNSEEMAAFRLPLERR